MFRSLSSCSASFVFASLRFDVREVVDGVDGVDGADGFVTIRRLGKFGSSSLWSFGLRNGTAHVLSVL